MFIGASMVDLTKWDNPLFAAENIPAISMSCSLLAG